jgi:hypothetical protein
MFRKFTEFNIYEYSLQKHVQFKLRLYIANIINIIIINTTYDRNLQP